MFLLKKIGQSSAAADTATTRSLKRQRSLISSLVALNQQTYRSKKKLTTVFHNRIAFHLFWGSGCCVSSLSFAGETKVAENNGKIQRIPNLRQKFIHNQLILLFITVE